jgi:hypothetical protein
LSITTASHLLPLGNCIDTEGVEATRWLYLRRGEASWRRSGGGEPDDLGQWQRRNDQVECRDASYHSVSQWGGQIYKNELEWYVL